MTEGFEGVYRMQMRGCPVCAAVTDDPKAHMAWHERLRDAIEHGMPVLDPDDIDQ